MCLPIFSPGNGLTFQSFKNVFPRAAVFTFVEFLGSKVRLIKLLLKNKGKTIVIERQF